MTRIYFFWRIGLTLVVYFTSSSWYTVSHAQAGHNGLESTIDSLLRTPGHQAFNGSILIASEGKLVVHKSYGNAQLSAGYWIGSMSKAFTAAAILKLQEEGKLSVSDSIGKFLWDVPLEKRGITIHHLLTHSSGLGDRYVSDGLKKRQEAVEAILASKMIGGIGEKYFYSVEGYNLLAILVEIAAGDTFEGYLTKTIIEPAQLTNTGFWGFEDADSDNIAPWYNPRLMKNYGPTIIEGGISISNYGFKGATGLFSTTGDLIKWLGAIRSSGLLDSTSLAQMYHPHVAARGDSINGVFYGYGWFLEYRDGRLYEIRHGGAEADGIGHSGMVRVAESGDQIIVLSNSAVVQGQGRLKGVDWGIALSIELRDLIEGHF